MDSNHSETPPIVGKVFNVFIALVWIGGFIIMATYVRMCVLPFMFPPEKKPLNIHICDDLHYVRTAKGPFSGLGPYWTKCYWSLVDCEGVPRDDVMWSALEEVYQKTGLETVSLRDLTRIIDDPRCGR